MGEGKNRAERNKTIHLTPDQEREYLKKCVDESSVAKNTYLIDKIIHGDCFNVLPNLQEKTVDLLIADPPYNLARKFSTSTFHEMDTRDYGEFTRKWIQSLLHTLKQTASVYVCCDWKTSLIIGGILSEYFIVRNRITWQRDKGRGALSNWKNSMEDIWYATISNEYSFDVESVKQRRKVVAPYRADGKPKDWEKTENGNFRDTYPSNFWDDITIPYWSMPENTDHPTQKPEKLFAKLILASSNSGDTVLDPFAGTGTSNIVAKKLGRHYIGIETEAEYCALAQKRLELAEKVPSIQGYSGGVFWERNSLSDQKRLL